MRRLVDIALGVAAVASRIVGAFAVLVAALIVGVATQSGTPAFRRTVVRWTNRALAGSFRGSVVALGVQRLTWNGADGATLVATDPEGRVVVRAEGVRLRLDTPRLVWSLVRRGPLFLSFGQVRARVVEVTLAPDPQGRPSLVDTFAPPPSGKRGGASPSLELRRVDVERLHVRGMLPAPILAHVVGRAEIPSGGDGWAVSALDGTFGEVPFRLRIAESGRVIDGELVVEHASAEALRAILVPVPAGVTLSLRAEVSGAIPYLWARAHVKEHGGEGRLDASSTIDATNGILDGVVRADRVDLSHFVPGAPASTVAASGTFLARLSGGTKVIAAVQAPAVSRGTLQTPPFVAVVGFDVPAETSAGALDASFATARFGELRLGRGALRAAWSGPLARPRGALSVQTAALFAGERLVGEASAEVPFEVSGEGLVSTGAGARLSRGGVTAEATVGRLEVGRKGVMLSRVVLRGLGKPVDASFTTGASGLSLQLAAPGIDVPSLEAILGQEPGGRGRVSLDADLRTSRGVMTGRAAARFELAGLLHARESRGSMELTLAGRAITGRAEGSLDSAKVHAALEGEVAGPPLRLASWSRATATLRVDATMPLASMTEWLPEHARAWRPTSGLLTMQAVVARERTGALPHASVDLSTRDAALGAPTRLTGVDATAHVTLDESGSVGLKGDVHDRRGVIASFEGEARVPMRHLLEAPRELPGELERARTQVRVDVPGRPLSSLPGVLLPPLLRGVGGELSATLTGSGTLLDPRVELHATGHQLAPPGGVSGGPFDGALDGTYDGRLASARVALSRGGQQQLEMRATANVPVASVLRGTPDWDADADLSLEGFPIQSVPAVAQHRLGGAASGKLSFHGLHRDARVDGTVSIAQLRLGRACFDAGEVKLRYDGARLSGEVSVHAPSSSAAVTIDAPARWGAALRPSFEPGQPVAASFVAKGFRAAALLPLLWGPVNRLEGRIDADAKAVFTPDLARGTWNGDLRLAEGVVEVPALGEQLEDVTAKVTVGPWGTLRIEGVSATNGGGRVTGSGQATFVGPELRTATADVQVASDKRFPLTIAGVPFGQVSGSVHAEGTMTADRKTLDTKVVAKDIQVDLPEATGHSLQPLQPAAAVQVGVVTPSGSFVPVASGPPHPPPAPPPFTLHANLDLGELRIRRGVALDITVTGHPVADLSDKTTMNGVVDLARGHVEVFGKRFTLEPSTLAFTGDPARPQLHVTAKYDAPDKTAIYADVTGTLANIKLHMRSEPPMTQDEIVSLLLFGTETGGPSTAPVGAATPEVTQRAAGVAGGVVAQGVNEALSGITSLQIATRVDTSQATNPRPMVEVRLSSNVVTRVTVQTGVPLPGQPPDLTLVTFGWNFHPRWSLQTTVGDAGSTAIEILWRHRY